MRLNMKPLHDDLMKLVGGGYDIEDLTPEEYAELEKWGRIYIDEQMKNEADVNKAMLAEAKQQLQRLDELFKQKYGRA